MGHDQPPHAHVHSLRPTAALQHIGGQLRRRVIPSEFLVVLDVGDSALHRIAFLAGQLGLVAG